MRVHAKRILQALRGQHLKRLSEGHQSPPFQYRQTIAAQRLIQVMQGDQCCHWQRLHHVQDRELVLDVQVIGRFVEQQYLRALGQGAGDVDTLAFAAGQAVPGPVFQVRRIDVAQCLLDDGGVLVRPRTQGRQPGRPAQGHGIEHVDGITELKDETGKLLGERGAEFGTVTGRPRRCGWFDACLVRQTRKVAGINGIALTKLDVLDQLPELKICVGYRLDGLPLDHLPAAQGAQARVVPIYETMEGWTESTRGARSWAELPAQCIKYVRRLEELIGAPVALLSTSPKREDTILVHDPFVD